jgi:hypothetical protein
MLDKFNSQKINNYLFFLCMCVRIYLCSFCLNNVLLLLVVDSVFLFNEKNKRVVKDKCEQIRDIF